MPSKNKYWEILGPDREILAYVNVGACGFTDSHDALRELSLLNNCYISGTPVALTISKE